jgi:hypothetical protein
METIIDSLDGSGVCYSATTAQPPFFATRFQYTSYYRYSLCSKPVYDLILFIVVDKDSFFDLCTKLRDVDCCRRHLYKEDGDKAYNGISLYNSSARLY